MDNDMKNNYPRMPDGFDRRILQKLDAPERKVFRLPKKAVLIAVAAVVTALLTVFAGGSAINRFFSKSAEHQLVLTEPDSDGAERIVPVRLERTYLPAFVKPDEQNEIGFFVRDPSGADEAPQWFYDGLSPLRDASRTYSWVQSVRYETFGDHDGAVVMKQDLWEGARVLFIRFPEYGLLYEAYVPPFLPDEEMRKLAEGVRLTPTGETEPAYTDGVRLKDRLGDGQTPICRDGLFADPAPLDEPDRETTFLQAGYGEALTDYATGVRYTFTNGRVIDSIDGLDPAHLTAWEGLVNADGTFPRYDREAFAFGDGVNTLTEKTGEKNVGRRVLLVEITAVNTRDKAVTDWLSTRFCGGWDEASLTANFEKYNYAVFYDSEHGGADSLFGCVELAPGQTRTVTAGFMFDDDLPLDAIRFGVDTGFDQLTTVPVF